jgi:hypothetical protein
MSGFTHSHAEVGPFRTRLLPLIALVVAAAALAVLVALLATRGDSPAAQHAGVAPISASIGPNEAARGVSAATATGGSAPFEAGGPDESARGIAAASAGGASGRCGYVLRRVAVAAQPSCDSR